jgi:hypothetical protein
MSLAKVPSIVRVIELRSHAAPMGEMRNAYKILVGKSEGKRPFERRRRR